MGPNAVECFATSRRQDGRSVNQDAFLIARRALPAIAVCDGAGQAQQVARRALGMFEKLLTDADEEAVGLFPTWARWVKAIDSALLGGAQSTLVAVAVLDGRIVGACAGDSRAYLWHRDGSLQILTEGAAKFRLGSGRVEPFPIHAPLESGEVVLLMTDGAWTPLSLHALRKVVAGSALGAFPDLPGRILDAAGRSGRADDMTVAALRLRS